MAGQQAAPPADEVAKFTAAANAAMNDILRARKDAGVAPSDPMEPLIQALARSVSVLGRLPAVLAQRQHDAEVEAVQGMTWALQDALANLVNQAGADMAAKAKLRWLCWTGGLLALVFGLGWYFLTDRAFDAGVASEHWRAEAAISEAQNTAQFTKTPDGKARGWWVSGLSDDQYQRARWAAEMSTLEPLRGLSASQVQHLGFIAQEAEGWAKMRKENDAPWPCIRYETSDRWSWNGKKANVCITGYGNN